MHFLFYFLLFSNVKIKYKYLVITFQSLCRIAVAVSVGEKRGEEGRGGERRGEEGRGGERREIKLDNKRIGRI
jgi:hypothetical protein